MYCIFGRRVNFFKKNCNESWDWGNGTGLWDKKRTSKERILNEWTDCYQTPVVRRKSRGERKWFRAPKTYLFLHPSSVLVGDLLPLPRFDRSFFPVSFYLRKKEKELLWKLLYLTHSLSLLLFFASNGSVSVAVQEKRGESSHWEGNAFVCNSASSIYISHRLFLLPPMTPSFIALSSVYPACALLCWFCFSNFSHPFHHHNTKCKQRERKRVT